jgi:hypothetical protein
LATSIEKAIKLLPRCVGGHAQGFGGICLALPQSDCITEKEDASRTAWQKLVKTLRHE